MRARGIIAGLALSLLGGCGTPTAAADGSASAAVALPAFFYDPVGSPNDKCLPDTHMAAVGSSPAGRADAEKAAVARLITQIGSKVQVEQKRVVEVAKQDGAVSSRRTLNTEMTEKSDFAHRELIHTVGAPGVSDGETFVLVCMDRDEARDVLEKDLAEHLTTFHGGHEKAQAALAEGNTAAFTTAFTAAEKHTAPLLRGFAEIRAVSGESREERTFRAESADLVKGAQSILSVVSVRIVVDAGDIPADQARAAGDAFRAAIADLGVSAEMSQAVKCEKSAGVYLVAVKGTANCKWGSLGHACTPQFAVRALECGTTPERTVFEAEVPDQKKLVGNHPRDQNLALARALKDLRADLAPTLKQLFSAELPIE